MDNKKRVAFLGTGGVFSNIVLRNLVESDIDISFVVILTKSGSDLVPMNEALCNSLKIPFIKINNTNSDYVINTIIDKRIDLGIVASYSQIFKLRTIQAFRDGLINVHPSYLPYYKGANPLFWQVKDLKDEFGVTIHKINEKIDEGEILVQDLMLLKDIASSDLIFNRVAQRGSELLVPLIDFYLHNGEMSSFNKEVIKSDNEGFYNHKPKEEDFEVDPFGISPPELAKLVSRMKKWGLPFMYYNKAKLFIDYIEILDTNRASSSINQISSNRYIVNGEMGRCIVVTRV